MIRRARLPSSLAFVTALAACAAPGTPREALAQLDEMMALVDRVQQGANRARDAVNESFLRLRELADGDYGETPPATVYERFVQSIDTAEQELQAFRATSAPMLQADHPVFARWQRNAARITSQTMRERCEFRLQDAQARFLAIGTIAERAAEQFATFNTSLRDTALFLALDLNPGALAELQEVVESLSRTAQEIDLNLEATIAVARAYVDQGVMPPAAAPPK